MSDWDGLARELDTWATMGRCATLWWRDDDATRPTPALERVLALSAATATPVALAVIPRDATDELSARLAEAPGATALQHGYAHANHAGDGDRQNEYGPERPVDARCDELAIGWRRLHAFPKALPVLVAPWNRIEAAFLPALPSAGLAGVSTLGPRVEADPAPGVRQVNVHVDLMNWERRRFAGLAAAIEQLLHHLAARRQNLVDPTEPTGMMTHHGFHDEEAWSFIGELIERTRAHPAARWLSAEAAFWP